jgi:hypothetical protein
MKKLLFMLMGVAATINVMAVDYTAKANLLLEATSGEDCEMYLRQSDSYGALEGYDMYMDNREVALYAINGEQKLQMAKAKDLTNLALGLKTDASTSYTITVSGADGDLVLYDLADMTNIKSYPLVNGQINFTAPANSTIENRFVINYQAPAPACTTVRNSLTVDQYYTICLDRVIESANASFWSMQYRNAEGSLAYLVEEQFPLVAGRPYIFQAEDAELCAVLSGDPVNGPGNFGALYGTFTAMDQNALSEAATSHSSLIYLLNNNELRPAEGTGNNLPANRAFIVYNKLEESAPNAPGRRVRAIPMQPNVATGIDAINANEAPVKMVIDGKMVIIRGEHMFDATGRMVK